jgi:hypothetical protein
VETRWLGSRVRLVDTDQQDEDLRPREEILAALEHFPAEFKRLVLDPADREALMRPAFDGGWGIVEILPHLRDWEEIYLDRISRMLTEDNAALPAFDDTLWSIERDYRGQDPHETYASLSTLRKELTSLLGAATPDQWERIGVHGYYGEITVHWMANHICDHDAEHLQQAREALTV